MNTSRYERIVRAMNPYESSRQNICARVLRHIFIQVIILIIYVEHRRSLFRRLLFFIFFYIDTIP